MQYQRPLAICLGAFLLCAPVGCSIHYHNPKNGSDNIVGFGFLKMRVASGEGVQAYVTGISTYGATIGLGKHNGYISAGVNKVTRVIVSTNTSVRLDWPQNSLFDVQVATNFNPSVQHANNKEIK